MPLDKTAVAVDMTDEDLLVFDDELSAGWASLFAQKKRIV
jgi:hypothetical protein